MLESSWNHSPSPPTAVHGKAVFHEIGSWCQKVGDHWAIGQFCLRFLMLLSGSGQQTPPLEAFQPILGDEFHHLNVLFYSSWNTYTHHKHKSVEGKISIWTNEATLKGVWESGWVSCGRLRTKQQPEVSLHIQRIRKEFCFIFVYWVEKLACWIAWWIAEMSSHWWSEVKFGWNSGLRAWLRSSRDVPHKCKSIATSLAVF